MDSVIHDWYIGADLLDAQAVLLSADAPDDAIALAHRMLDRPPWAFRILMAVRDAVMARLGVKSSSSIRDLQDGRERIDFFPVFSKTPEEVVFGADDKHLDFRTSIMIVPHDGGRRVVSTTAVRCHNRLGRLYLRIITPFHVSIVRAALIRLESKR